MKEEIYNYITKLQNQISMEKKEKHLKAQAFRERIAMPTQRKSAIMELVSKSEFSEVDRVYLDVLFQKTSYISGCQHEYRLLIIKLRTIGESTLSEKISTFEKRL